MELRTLEYFLMVAREENITKAAEILHMTQPTLSRAMMQLEKEIGKPLFFRGKRKITLTDEGMLLRRRAEDILSLVSKTESELRKEDHELIGELTIGCAECQASHLFLPRVIETFTYLHPKVTYDLHTGNADLIKERIEAGLIDVGIVLEPVDLEKYEYVRLPYHERMGIILSKDHPLSQKSKVTSKDLLEIPLGNVRRNLLKSELASWFKEDYEKIHIIETHDMISNTIPLCAQGICAAISVEGAFYGHSDEKVTFIPFEPELANGTVLIWRKNRMQSALVKEFIQYVYHTLDE